MKPILFNTEGVKAILDGRKSVTRRVVKPQPLWDSCGMRWWWKGKHFWWRQGWDPMETITEKHSLFKVGDILYVRETFTEMPYGYVYRADGNEPESWDCDDRWRPSIHMPKEAARLFLRVTGVRAEKLLSPFFANGTAIMVLKPEGTMLPDECVECINNYGHPSCIDTDSECGILDEVRGGFSELWDSTIKKADLPRYGWAANPWVWVIEFERISSEEAIENALPNNL